MLIGILVAAGGALPAFAATASLLILHTNDLHDHLRPGANGQGGLPWVSGYVKQVRSERKDVLLLDAGDVAEKGDLVAFKTHSTMTYEAMRRIGYDGVAIGNHDYDPDPTFKRLSSYVAALGQPLLCINLLHRPGEPTPFVPSRVFTVSALKVGVIGAIVPRREGGLNFDDSGRAIAREAERLRRDVHLVVVVCHEGSANCAKWSQMAPAVDVFVSGHTHELLPKPLIVPTTGARIVQAGYYARHVGRLDLVIDLETKKIIRAEGEVVPLTHATTPVDHEMLEWVRRREQELCPEASKVLVPNTELVSMTECAWLGAEALRRAAGTDIAFCHVGQIIRSPIFAGPVDVNALHLSGGDRGQPTIRTELTGAEIAAYLNALGGRENDQTVWSGFKATQRATAGAATITTDLVAEKSYTVIMPELEWTTRFLRSVERTRETKAGGPLVARTFTTRPDSATFTDAMHRYVERLTADGRTLKQAATRLAAEQSDGVVIPAR